MTIYKTTSKNVLKYIPLFLFPLWPFLSFVFSLLFFRSKISGLIFVLFFAVLGLSFTFENQEVDSYRYAVSFINYSNYNNDFFELYKNAEITDIYTHVFYAFVSSFSKNPKILFGFFGLVYGLFYYLSLRIIIIERVGKSNMFFLIVFVLFAFLNPYSNLNGVRFWTATFIFFYSTVQYSIYHKKSWLVGILSVVFIHYSFSIPALLVLVLNKYIIKYENLFWWIFICSIPFYLFIDVINILGHIPYLDSEFGYKLQVYTDVARRTEISKALLSASWLFKLYNYLPVIFSFFVLYVIRRNISNINKDVFLCRSYSITLLFFSFSNVLCSVPSMSRFYVISYMFLFFLIYKIYNQNRTKTWKSVIILSVPIFGMSVIQGIMLGNSIFNIDVYYSTLLDIVKSLNEKSMIY